MKKWASKKILLCPVCGKAYEYCHGKIKTPYFRHMDKNICEYKYAETETEEHLNGKRDLYEWIKNQTGVTNAVLEGWIPDTKQRPDIMFNYKGYSCVIEYQCSPISSEYLERHDLYKTAGIKDIWVCGVNNYLQYYNKGKSKRFNSLEELCLTYYESNTRQLYKLEDLSELELKELEKLYDLRSGLRNKYCSDYKKRKYLHRKDHIMTNPYDYVQGYKNYMFVKSGISNSYICSGSHYPSGRRSNKYPYPIKDYVYMRNKSLATCYKLDNLQLKNII